MALLAAKREKSTMYRATTDKERTEQTTAARGLLLNKYWKIPDLSQLEAQPTWKT